MDIRFQSLYDSFKEISNKINNSSHDELSSVTSINNSSNDHVSQLDLWCNDLIEKALKMIPKMCGFISEEKNEPVFFEDDRDFSNYNLFCFIDPLDGSKNIEVNGVVGTIYTILGYDKDKDETGTILEAGYVMYGPKTLLVIGNDSSSDKLHIFELNNQNIWSPYATIPSFEERIGNNQVQSKTYFLNEAYALNFESKINNFIQELKSNNFSQRWSGSMIMDCHHLFLKGGIFAYPGNKKSPTGKLRYLYEVIPFCYLLDILGGFSLLGNCDYEPELLNKQIKLRTPKEIHQSIEIILVSPQFKNYLERILDN